MTQNIIYQNNDRDYEQHCPVCHAPPDQFCLPGYHMDKSTNTKAILAFDPGVSTGVAYKMPDGEYMTVCLGQYEEDEVWGCIDPNTISAVLYEEFKCTTISKFGLYTVRLIGGIIALCHANKIQVVRQHPQQRRSFIPIAKKYLQDNKGERFKIHEVDALSHIMYFEYQTGMRKFDVVRLAAQVGKGKTYRGL